MAICKDVIQLGVIIETPIWFYIRFYAEQHGIPRPRLYLRQRGFCPLRGHKSIKDVLEKQTFQCVKNDSKLHWREINAFLNICYNVDEYHIAGDGDNVPLCVQLGVLHDRLGLELYCIPSKLEGNHAVLPRVDLLQTHVFFKSELSQILIPNTIRSIKSRVFVECPNLEELSLPASVTSIGNQRDLDSLAPDCPRLQAITVNPVKPKYFGIDGVLYCKGNGCLLTYPTDKSGSFYFT